MIIVSDNKEDRQVIYEKEGVVVQYALKNCPCKVKVISKKCNLTIDQMAQICNGYHPDLKDYVLILSHCLKRITPTKGKHRHILPVLNKEGIDINQEDFNRLILGDCTNPLDYDKVLHVICLLPEKRHSPSSKSRRGSFYLGSNKTSQYYKQPYVRANDQTRRSNDFEYGLTDT